MHMLAVLQAAAEQLNMMSSSVMNTCMHNIQYCCAATDELTDMQLQYQSDDLSMEHIPKGWPQPKEPLFPFNGALTDYCRLVAPGVLVGVGWKAARPGRDVGRRFLHFMLVKKYP